jgi:phenylacetate-coenzyme A ligase PaaK-like adenylate-forming protein
MERHHLNEIGSLALNDLQNDQDAKNYLLRTTSGTSGNEPLFIVRKRKQANVGFFSGLKRIVGFFGVYNARLSHLSSTLMRKNNSKALFLDYKDLDNNMENLIRQFRPDGFCGFPSYIIKSLEYINDPAILHKINSVRLTGEALSPQKISILKEKIPFASIQLFYAAAEVGFISSFCSKLPLGQYHPKEGTEVYLKNVDDDGIGEIIINTSLSDTVRVKEYEIGDIGRLIKEPCACGNPTTFEVLGRKNFDFIKLCGAILNQNEFDRVMGELREYIIDYRGFVKEVVINKTSLLGEVTLEIIPNDPLNKILNPEKFISEEISKKLFATPTQTLFDLIDKDVFLPTKIIFKNDLPKNHKDIKLVKKN